MALALCVCASAQTETPTVRVTFDDAIKRAIEKNPTVQAAASAILRAEGLVRQARAATRLQITGNVTTTTLNTGVEFQGATVTPQNQVTASLTGGMPIVAAAAWARRAQAEDMRTIAELSVADTRRQIAFAAADAYLTILAQRRVVESNGRARDTAKAHFDLASELERQGTGSRLNALRAQQQLSTDEALVESARLALYRAQEALGVLIAADEPADAIDDPAFTVPADETQPGPKGPGPPTLLRTDLKLFAGQQQAAEHVLRDSSKDWWPTVDALFQPSTTYPPPVGRVATPRAMSQPFQYGAAVMGGGCGPPVEKVCSPPHASTSIAPPVVFSERPRAMSQPGQ